MAICGEIALVVDPPKSIAEFLEQFKTSWFLIKMVFSCIVVFLTQSVMDRFDIFRRYYWEGKLFRLFVTVVFLALYDKMLSSYLGRFYKPCPCSCTPPPPSLLAMDIGEFDCSFVFNGTAKTGTEAPEMNFPLPPEIYGAQIPKMYGGPPPAITSLRRNFSWQGKNILRRNATLHNNTERYLGFLKRFLLHTKLMATKSGNGKVLCLVCQVEERIKEMEEQAQLLEAQVKRLEAHAKKLEALKPAASMNFELLEALHETLKETFTDLRHFDENLGMVLQDIMKLVCEEI